MGGAARPCARAPASSRPPVAKGRPERARPRFSAPPLARRVVRRAPARRLPRIAWSARLAAPLPRPSILLQPPSREARAAPAAGGREVRDEKPARLGVGVPCEERAGGDARQGGLDRRVGGLPPPPAPPAAWDLRRLHPTGSGTAPSVNPDPSPQGLGPSSPEEGVAGALRAKFEAGEAASGAPGFSGGAGAQMATQVEPLLPGGAPLLQAEEHGGLVRKKLPPPPEGKGEPGANDVGGGESDGGARRPRPPCAKPHKEGTGQLERESPRPPQPPGAEGLAFSDGEEGGGGEPGAGGGAAGAAGAGRRDFVEAPPPKVNPWTKNALPPVLATVNGQSPPGGSSCLLCRVRGPFPGI